MHVKVNCKLLYHFWCRVDGDEGVGDFLFPSEVPKRTSVGEGKEMVYSSLHQMRKVLSLLCKAVVRSA